MDYEALLAAEQGVKNITVGYGQCGNLVQDVAAIRTLEELTDEYLEKNGFDYVRVRLYEASLFLSMLPYHMDQPGKVFGFLMNAIRILEEVETCTKI